MTVEPAAIAPDAAPPAAAAAPLQTRLPPGPRLPRIVQTAAFLLAAPRFLEACRRRYGGAVYLSTIFDGGFVMVFDPALVKQVFQGPHAQLNAGEANVLLGPILGERSVLVLDGAEHLRHRRLMLPPFHGQRMQLYENVIRAAADAEIDSWPVGQPFAALPSLQAMTLRVIVRAVFGYEAGADEQELRRRLRAMVKPVAQPRGLLSLFLLPRIGLDRARKRFETNRDAADELLLAEIERRRAQPDLADRDDVFSALLLAEDEAGQRLTPREVRDELVTLLLAGHETTATGLAWTLDLLLHNPAVLARAREGDDAYLDAVVKESLRLRSVIPGVGRVVRGEPFRLGEFVIPPGVEINPSIRMIHRRADLYPDPNAFRPERFLGAEPQPDDPGASRSAEAGTAGEARGRRAGGVPDTYTWLPFGGGTRRCLGASFALMEMRVVLKRILERAALRAADPKLDKVQFRAITLAPKTGVRIVMDSRTGVDSRTG
jgi:cytochrome P450 family 135